MCTQHTSRARSVKSLSAGVNVPLKSPGSPRVLDALSCYVSLILTHSDTKQGLKNVIGQKSLDPPMPLNTYHGQSIFIVANSLVAYPSANYSLQGIRSNKIQLIS